MTVNSTMSAISSTNRFARAFSLRDKARGSSKTRALDFGGVFSVEDSKKKPTKDEEKKIHEITLHFAQLGKSDFHEGRIVYALRAKSAQGNVQEAQRLLMIYEDSVAGVLRPYNPNVKLLGAENREKTTCYIDALLFAMFTKSDVFEAVLFNTYDDEHRRTLVMILRLWVNLLRTGKLVTVDITHHLQASIAECGWRDAAKIRQQDASEAFNFLTDKLQLPLLTLKTDIYHAGEKDDSDDHKFITERMLDVAIPDSVPQGQVLTLESCLEEYFNNRVEVKRHLQRRNTVNSVTSAESTEKSDGIHVETVEIDSRTPSPAPQENNVRKSSVHRPLLTRTRATSIFSDRKVDVADALASNSNGVASTPGNVKTTKQARKEVLMPAWQFLNLIPWYTDNIPENDPQVRSHFSRKRLMLGICLKRYGYNSNGTPFRKNAHIDIPLELASPHFTTGNELDQEGTVARDFKLTLKSVVCHRGHSVDAGHYIALVRAGTPGVDRHEAFADPARRPSHDASHDTWLRFDDLASERVTTVDITKALKDESPYLLFYAVQSISDDMPDENPPPYQESEASFDLVDQKLSSLGPQSRDSIEVPPSQSGRESLEVASPDDPRRSSVSSIRRQSQQFGSAATSIKMDQMPTEPTTPLEEMKSAPNAVSRQTNKSKTEGRQSTDGDVNNKFATSMSKLAARLSRDKLNNPDIVVDEIADESVLPKATKDDGSEGAKAKSKERKKKFIPIPKSRRDSAGGGPVSEKPDRECAVM